MLSTTNDSNRQDNEDEEDILMNKNMKRKKIIKKYRLQRFKGSYEIILKYLSIAFFTLAFAAVNLICVLYQKK